MRHYLLTISMILFLSVLMMGCKDNCKTHAELNLDPKKVADFQKGIRYVK